MKIHFLEIYKQWSNKLMTKCFYVFAVFLSLTLNSVMAQEFPTPTFSLSDFDDSIIHQEVCNFPCWYGITPGITTVSELKQGIEKITFYSKASTKKDDIEPPTTSNLVMTEFLRWWHSSPSKMNKIIIKDGIVSQIEIRETVDFTLGDVIDLYGEPTGVNVIYDVGVERLYLNLILQVYYPNRGLAIDFRLVALTGEVYVPEVTISRNAIGSRFYVVPSQDNLKDFVLELGNPYTIYPVHEGWIGIGGKILSPKPETYPYGLPTYEANIESTEEPV